MRWQQEVLVVVLPLLVKKTPQDALAQPWTDDDVRFLLFSRCVRVVTARCWKLASSGTRWLAWNLESYDQRICMGLYPYQTTYHMIVFPC